MWERASAAASSESSAISRSMMAAIVWGRGNSMMRRGRFAEAVAHYERTLAIEEELYGRDDGRVAQVLVHLAEAQRVLGRADEARTLYLRAYEILQPLPDDRVSEKLLLGLGEIHLERNEIALARRYQEAAAATCERRNCDPTMRGVIGHTLARTLVAEHASPADIRAQIEEAIAWSRRAPQAEQEMLLAELQPMAAQWSK
jgi:tetratricopeptide (TPR) repeat protein